jgi:hypothetical protein
MVDGYGRKHDGAAAGPAGRIAQLADGFASDRIALRCRAHRVRDGAERGLETRIEIQEEPNPYEGIDRATGEWRGSRE